MNEWTESNQGKHRRSCNNKIKPCCVVVALMWQPATPRQLEKKLKTVLFAVQRVTVEMILTRDYDKAPTKVDNAGRVRVWLMVFLKCIKTARRWQTDHKLYIPRFEKLKFNEQAHSFLLFIESPTLDVTLTTCNGHANFFFARIVNCHLKVEQIL